MTGCCHGKISDRFGIAYTNSTSAANGIPYFPIQLVCSLGNLLLFVIVLLYERRHHKAGHAVIVYLLLYSVGRFFIEFFRGDSIRGFVFGVSTSQWISIILLLSILAFRLFNHPAHKAATDSPGS